jgi:hypothetical protein|tara:strand:- start:366 stop:1262 length:897 start_codon:yes stop_codon:yes gene_type:complete
MIRKMQTGGATSYEQMLGQLYGNIGSAGQAYTANILKPAIAAGAPNVPKLEVAGPSALQEQMFNLAAQGAADARDYFGTGIGALNTGAGYVGQAAESRFDPSADTQKFMNPYQQNVIDEYTKEMQRQFDISRQGRSAQAVQSGAFGGGREGVVEAEATRGFQDTLGRGIAGLMSSGFQQAQKAAMDDYQNQLRNLQTAGQTMNQQGQVLGQFGQAAPQALSSMVGTLGKAGATQYNLGQAQNQALFDQQMGQFRLPQEMLQLQSGIVSGFSPAIGFAPPTGGQGGGINPLLQFMGALF